MSLLIALIASYCLGSLSVAILLSKMTGGDDPRHNGSGNAGATNVLRTRGKKDALIVLTLDMAKGIVALIFAGVILNQSGFALALVALAAVLGHIFPVFFKFKGGKGVATSAGVILVLSPVVAILSALIWGGVVYAKRYVSLGSIVASIAAAVLMWFIRPAYAFPVTIIAALIIWKHLPNIQRLRDGIESKIQF
jgi:acyl phosphate:glycerol-3-phosphate acyltransferase